MDLAMIILGLFLLAAIIKNKDLSDAEEDSTNDGVFTFLSIFVLFMVFGGLGFLLPNSMYSRPNYSFLVPTYIFMVALPMFMKGNAKIVARVAAISVFVYVIMGSYM
jgi:hypothetical protein